MPEAEAGLRARFAEMYAELRRVAAFLVMHERPSATLSATALVHDAYLKLLRSEDLGKAGIEHLVPLAALTMRRMLIDRARAARAWDRRRQAAPLDHDLPGADPRFARIEEIEAFDTAMRRLALAFPRQAAAYEFCVGWGVTAGAAAAQFGVSERTLQVDIAFARAFLRRQILGQEDIHVSPQ